MDRVGYAPVEMLLVEDNAGDVRLIEETFGEGKTLLSLTVAKDGIQAMEALRREGEFSEIKPIDLVVLDLNLPRKDGCEVLMEIRADEALKNIPVIVLTSSAAQNDVSRAYELNANCYVIKPIDLDEFVEAVRSIEDFWLTIVKLPANGAK